MYDVLQSLGTSVLGIAVFSAVLYKLNVAVILFIVVTTAVSFYLNKRVVKWTDEHSKERMSYVQRLNYINAISGDARSAKDIRLYPMAKWFSDIFMKFSSCSSRPFPILLAAVAKCRLAVSATPYIINIRVPLI